MRRLFLGSIIVFTVYAIAIAQTLYPKSGGVRSEPDPKNKDSIVLIAESDRVRLTIGTPKGNKVRSGLLAIWAKIENLSDAPLPIDPTKFSGVDDEGRAYAGLTPQEGIRRVLDNTSVSRAAVGIALGGPLTGPAMNEAAERKVTESLNRMCLQPGDIPPRSFKDGYIYFEAPTQKKFTIKIKLGELWPEPFVFSTEKPEVKKR